MAWCGAVRCGLVCVAQGGWVGEAVVCWAGGWDPIVWSAGRAGGIDLSGAMGGRVGDPKIFHKKKEA